VRFICRLLVASLCGGAIQFAVDWLHYAILFPPASPTAADFVPSLAAIAIGTALPACFWLIAALCFRKEPFLLFIMLGLCYALAYTILFLPFTLVRALLGGESFTGFLANLAVELAIGFAAATLVWLLVNDSPPHNPKPAFPLAPPHP
jgi:hypothetical protein